MFDITEVGKSFLEKHFGEGAYLTHEYSSTSLYILTETNGMSLHGETDSKTSTLMCDIAQPGVAPEDYLSVLWSDAEVNGEKEISWLFNFGYVPNNEVTDEYKNKIYQKAIAIIEDVLNMDVAEDCLEGKETYDVKLGDRDAFVKIIFEWQNSGEDEQYSYMIIQAYTDMENRY